MANQSKLENTLTSLPIFTIPIDKTQEIEVIFRLRKRTKKINWGEELLRVFQPARERSKKYSLVEINKDIRQAINENR